MSDFPKNSDLEQEYETSLSMADRMLLVDALRVAGVMVSLLTRGKMPNAQDMLITLRLGDHALDVIALIDKLTLDVAVIAGKPTSTLARELRDKEKE